MKALTAAADLLQALSKPFMNWAVNAERHQISVPMLPLFVHEGPPPKRSRTAFDAGRPAYGHEFEGG